jgi:hypothetical protein
MRIISTFVLAVLLGAAIPHVQAAKPKETKETLMLGGRFCEFYPKELTDALMAVPGVKAVDLKSMKGHVIVIHDGNVKLETLVAAVKGVKGSKVGVEWYCTAEAMK